MVWIWVSESLNWAMIGLFWQKLSVWIRKSNSSAIRVIFVRVCILIACGAGWLNISPTLMHILSVLFRIQINRSCTTKHPFYDLYATCYQKKGWFGFIFFDFQNKTPVSKIFYACLASNSMIWLHKRKESLITQIIPQLSQVFPGTLQSCRLRCCAFKLFLLFVKLFDAKVLLIGHVVTQNYVFVVF